METIVISLVTIAVMIRVAWWLSDDEK